jgi:ABC-type bacteriocin/lantibiotic exporter with double-glycine peptidase domain
MIYLVLAFLELCRYGIVIYAIYLVSIGKMEIGTVLLIYSYYAKIITNFEVLGTINAEFQSVKVSISRLNKIKSNQSREQPPPCQTRATGKKDKTYPLTLHIRGVFHHRWKTENSNRYRTARI